MSFVTARILSNLEVHGLEFAVDQEARRLIRKGYGKATATKMARAMVAQVAYV